MAEDKRKKHFKGRRDALKTLATVPVLGAMAYGVYKKIKTNVRNVWRPICSVLRKSRFRRLLSMEKIRIGIIGYGIRGTQLMQALGFATPNK